MQLPKLTLVPPKIQSGDLFPALELVMSSKALEQAIAETKSQEKRKRILPTYVIVALVIAMNLWSADSIIDVFKNLVTGLTAQWIPKGYRWGRPTGSSKAWGASTSGINPYLSPKMRSRRDPRSGSPKLEALQHICLTLVLTPCCETTVCGLSSNQHQNQLNFKEKAIYLA